MDKTRRDAFLDTLFKEEFGIENAAATLKEGPEKLRAALAAKGVQSKEASADVRHKAQAEAIAKTAELMLSYAELQEVFDKRLSDVEAASAGTIAKLEAENKALKEQLDANTKALKDLTAVVKAGPKIASKAAETAADDEDENLDEDTKKAVKGMKDGLTNKEKSVWEQMAGIPQKEQSS